MDVILTLTVVVPLASAAILGGANTLIPAPVRVVLAAIAFCLVSASIYALNDVRDRHEDRRHPRKRFRPVAAGEVAPREAVIFGIVLMLSGLILARTHGEFAPSAPGRCWSCGSGAITEKSSPISLRNGSWPQVSPVGSSAPAASDVYAGISGIEGQSR